MMKKLLKKEEGFTLAELLIVVAIIAVLVAVSIPIFTKRLEKTREETDIANMRAAKAALIAQLLDEPPTDPTDYYYDAALGVLTTSLDSVTTYGKGTKQDGGSEPYIMLDGGSYSSDEEAAGKIIKISVTPNEDVESGFEYEVEWVENGNP